MIAAKVVDPKLPVCIHDPSVNATDYLCTSSPTIEDEVQVIRQVAKVINQRWYFRIPGCEYKAFVSVDARFYKAPLAAVQLFEVRLFVTGYADQLAISGECPAVVRVHERRRVAGISPTDAVASVAAPCSGMRAACLWRPE